MVVISILQTRCPHARPEKLKPRRIVKRNEQTWPILSEASDPFETSFASAFTKRSYLKSSLAVSRFSLTFDIEF